MRASPEALPRLTAEAYLALEREQETRHELVDGYLYSMTGASLRHDEIAMNLAAALHAHLKGGPCRVYKSDVKVRVGDDFYYPDITVRCGERDADDYALHDPRVIVEVLSPSTQRYDRGDKRLAYGGIPSLREYVLVSQDAMRVELLAGDEPAVILTGEEERLHLPSLDFSLSLEELYA